MARPLTEEGDGAPSLRPLWMLMPYLWPKGRPGLRLRVVVSMVCLVLAIAATGVFPLVMRSATNALSTTASISLGISVPAAWARGRRSDLWFSRYRSLNDPMEGFYEATVRVKKADDCDAVAREILWEKREIGICCFSDTKDSELMWVH